MFRPDVRPSWLALCCGVISLGVVVAGASPAQRAAACATCDCGDPTLVVMGAEQPFANRLRPSLNMRHRTDAVGRVGVDRVELSEQRLELAIAYAPSAWLMLSASVPLLRRQLDSVNLAREGYLGIGDSELRARVFVFRDRDLGARHLIALALGLKLPTAPVKASGTDGPNPELPAGTGSFDPLIGGTYSYFAQPWSFFVSEVLFIPTRAASGLRVGTSWRGTHTVQLQLHELLAVRMSAETRLEGRTRYGSVTVVDTGGFVLFAAPGVVMSLATDVVIVLAVHVPAINALHGTHDEGLILELGAALDL